MVKKQDAREWIEAELGARAAKALFKKIERLERLGATVAEIEEIVTADIMKHVRGRVRGHVIAMVGHIKTKP